MGDDLRDCDILLARQERCKTLFGMKMVNYLGLLTAVKEIGLNMAGGMQRSGGVKINMIHHLPNCITLLLDAGTYVRRTLCQCSMLCAKRARN